MDTVALFRDLDKFAVDFKLQFKYVLLEDSKTHRDRPGEMYPSEVMTMLLLFHGSNYRTFKYFYLDYACEQLRSKFPG